MHQPSWFGPHNAVASLQILQRFAEVLARPYSLDALAWELADQIGSLLGLEDCVIYVRDGEALVQAAAYGVKAEDRHVVEPIVIPVGEGIVGTVAATGRAEYVPDTREDPRYIADQFAGASELTVPVVFEGRVIAVLDSEDAQSDAFSEPDQAMFQLLASMCAGHFAWLEALRQRQREADLRRRDRIEALGLLAGGVAHDFNNLLGVVSLNLDLAEDARLDTRHAALEASRQAVERARGLTSQLATFSTGGDPLRELVQADDLVQELCQEAQEHERVALQLNLAGELPSLNADRTQLCQALRNLVRFFASGAVSPCHLEVAAEERDGSLHLEVGCADHLLDAEDTQHLFDPYYGDNRGAGLGLAAAYWIVSRHDGQLDVRSDATNGTTFHIRLPALPGRVVVSPGRPAVARSLSILVVDDEPALLRAVGSLLERMGHRVVACTDGWDAVRRWRDAMLHAPFDLAVLDLTHPAGQGGLETFRQLRALDPEVRGIVMSGYTDDDAMVAFREHGFCARLEKPFHRQQLARALQECLRLA